LAAWCSIYLAVLTCFPVFAIRAPSGVSPVLARAFQPPSPASTVDKRGQVVSMVADGDKWSRRRQVCWRDRHLKTEKDASDFLLIARYYADAGNLDRLYETEQALLEAAGFELEVAGAALLGKDVAEVCLPETTRQITAILTTTALRQRLVDQMLRHTLLFGDAADSGRVAQYLDAFQKGFGPT
jgi:predicted nucleotidyltransferase